MNVVKSDNTTERRYIKTGRIGMPGRVEVLSGLEAGERVELLRADEAVPADDDRAAGASTSDATAPEVDAQ